jgi:hypothetical protein
MITTIEQLIKDQIRYCGIKATIHRFSVMKDVLNEAIITLQPEHRSLASYLSDITPIMECIIESVKYDQAS